MSVSPLQLIKDGIIKDDMEKVIKGYRLLTGETIKQQTESVVAEIKEEEEEEEELETQTSSKGLDFSTSPREQDKSKFGRRESIKIGENTFVDDRTESTEEELKTPEVGRTPRRKGISLVEVKCHVCGNVEEINPVYKTGSYHRCDKCVG
mgnify:CR=1 FL=1|tara:strand:+ start:4189 stop:4638 length:450 start_codon:yes stop_codon:yes gene_type:complete